MKKEVCEDSRQWRAAPQPPHCRLRRTTRTSRACALMRTGRAVHYPTDEPGMRFPRAIPTEIPGQTNQATTSRENIIRTRWDSPRKAQMAELANRFLFRQRSGVRNPHARPTDRTGTKPNRHRAAPRRAAPRRAAASDARSFLCAVPGRRWKRTPERSKSTPPTWRKWNLPLRSRRLPSCWMAKVALT